jgi:hypothetical protein
VVVEEPRQTLWGLVEAAAAVVFFLAAPLLVLLATALVLAAAAGQTVTAGTPHCSALRLLVAAQVARLSGALASMARPVALVVAVGNVAQGYPPVAALAPKAATAAVPSTAPISPTAQVAVAVLAGVAETL